MFNMENFILTSKYSWKEIFNIKKGDKVISYTGEETEILNVTIVEIIEKSIFNLKLRDIHYSPYSFYSENLSIYVDNIKLFTNFDFINISSHIPEYLFGPLLNNKPVISPKVLSIREVIFTGKMVKIESKDPYIIYPFICCI